MNYMIHKIKEAYSKYIEYLDIIMFIYCRYKYIYRLLASIKEEFIQE